MNLPFPGNFRSRIEPKDSVTFLFRCVLQKSFAPAWERLCFRAEILKVEFMKTIFIKPQSYVPHQEIGDYVIIINAAKAKVTGNKVEDKIYYRHSMYPGGLKAESYGKMVARKPTFPMEHAVKGMLPNNRLGRKLFNNVKIYAGSEHPHMAQQPIAVEL